MDGPEGVVKGFMFVLPQTRVIKKAKNCLPNVFALRNDADTWT